MGRLKNAMKTEPPWQIRDEKSILVVICIKRTSGMARRDDNLPLGGHIQMEIASAPDSIVRQEGIRDHLVHY